MQINIKQNLIDVANIVVGSDDTFNTEKTTAEELLKFYQDENNIKELKNKFWSGKYEIQDSFLL